MSQEADNGSSLFIYILLAGVLIVIIASFYSFYFKKNYDFFVETECNPEIDTCFFRDCENNSEECVYTNNFSYYNQYTIKAKDFKVCKNEDCKEACGLGLIQCIKTECTDNDIIEGVCLLPSSTTNNDELINLDLEN